MDRPEITVIVSHFNRPAGLHRALDSIVAQDVAAQVIVCDDASTRCRALDVVEERHRARLQVAVITGERFSPEEKARDVLTMGRLVNAALLGLASAPLVAYLTDDAALAPGHLRRMIDWLRDHFGASAVCCRNAITAAESGARSEQSWVADAGGGPTGRPRLSDEIEVTMLPGEVRDLLRDRNWVDHSCLVHRAALRPTWPVDPAHWPHPDWRAWQSLAAISTGAWGFLPRVGAELRNTPHDNGATVARGGTVLDAIRARTDGEVRGY